MIQIEQFARVVDLDGVKIFSLYLCLDFGLLICFFA